MPRVDGWAFHGSSCRANSFHQLKHAYAVPRLPARPSPQKPVRPTLSCIRVDKHVRERERVPSKRRQRRKLTASYTNTRITAGSPTPHLGSTLSSSSSAASFRTPASPVRLYSRGQSPSWAMVDGCSLLRLPLTAPLAHLLLCLDSRWLVCHSATQLVLYTKQEVPVRHIHLSIPSGAIRSAAAPDCLHSAPRSQQHDHASLDGYRIPQAPIPRVGRQRAAAPAKESQGTCQYDNTCIFEFYSSVLNSHLPTRKIERREIASRR